MEQLGNFVAFVRRAVAMCKLSYACIVLVSFM